MLIVTKSTKSLNVPAQRVAQKFLFYFICKTIKTMKFTFSAMAVVGVEEALLECRTLNDTPRALATAVVF